MHPGDGSRLSPGRPAAAMRDVPIPDDAGVIRSVDPFIDRQHAAEQRLGLSQATGVSEHRRQVHEFCRDDGMVRAEAPLVDRQRWR